MNNISELNELIYAGSKLVCAFCWDPNWIPAKSTEKQSKPGWGILTRDANNKTTKTSQNDKEKRGAEKSGNKKKQVTHEK